MQRNIPIKEPSFYVRMKRDYEMHSKEDEAESGSAVQAQRPKSSGLLPKIVIVLLSVLLIVAVALLVTFVVLYATKSASSSSSEVCQSEACFDLAVQIKGGMDERVDPCEDFYNFTCGNWAAFNHIPEGDPAIRLFTRANFVSYLIIRK